MKKKFKIKYKKVYVSENKFTKMLQLCSRSLSLLLALSLYCIYYFRLSHTNLYLMAGSCFVFCFRWTKQKTLTSNIIGQHCSLMLFVVGHNNASIIFLIEKILIFIAVIVVCCHKSVQLLSLRGYSKNDIGIIQIDFYIFAGVVGQSNEHRK